MPLISFDAFPYRFVSFLLFLVCVNGIYDLGTLTIYPEDPHGGEGFSVAISSDGSIVASGAWFGGASSDFGPSVGRVYIYAPQGQHYKKVNTVTPHPLTEDNCDNQNCRFGASLSLSPDGTVLVVGALNILVNGVVVGGAYVFRTSDGWVNYVQEAFLQSKGGSYQGQAVALSGNGKTLYSGHFDIQTWDYNTSWGNHQSVYPDPNDGMKVYSAALDQSGNILVLGGCSLQPCTHAFLYTRNGTTWKGHLLSSTGDGYDFGNSITINGIGNIVAIGDNDIDGVQQSGLVSVYILKGGTWDTALALAHRPNIDLAIQTIRATDDSFGSGVSLSQSGDLLAIGAFQRSYLYQLKGDSYLKYYPNTHTSFGGWSIAISAPGTHFVVGFEGYAEAYSIDECNKSAPVCASLQSCVGISNPATCLAPLFASWSNKSSGKLHANIQVTYDLTNSNDKVTNVFLNGSAYQYAKGPNQEKPVITMLSNRTVTVTLNPILPANKPLLLYLQSWPVGHYAFSEKFTVHSHNAADYTISTDNKFVVNPNSAPFSGIFQFQRKGISTLHLTCVSVHPKFLFFTFATWQ